MGRHLVWTACLLALAVGCSKQQTGGKDHCPPDCPLPQGLPGLQLERQAGPNLVAEENQKPGDNDWRKGGSAAQEGELDMYLSVDSVQAGDTVAVRAHSRDLGPFTTEVFRLGYYQGAGARRVWSGGQVQIGPQPGCPMDHTTGLIECKWADAFAFTVPQDWVTGVYVVKITRSDGVKRFAPFVVRDRRAAEVLYQVAFSTYAAYNRWGGVSLYLDETNSLANGRAWAVSLDRPFRETDGGAQVLRWEYPLVRMLEQYGYDVTYASNTDFTRYKNLVDGIGLFVHGGHDEYWAAEERTQLDWALSTGKTSLAYFGANPAYWRVRLEPNGQGTGLRRIYCFKDDADKDPQPNSTIRFRDPPNALPESLLYGSMYRSYQTIGFPAVVGDPAHWLYEGTGLQRGELLPGLVGYEFDRVFDEYPTPPGVHVISDSPVVTAEGLPERQQTVERTLPSGRLIFSAGSIYWPLGLYNDPETADGRIVRMTLNVLERGLTHRRPPRALTTPASPRPAVQEPIGRWAKEVRALAGAPSTGGHVDGAADQARFSGPTDLAANAAGEVFVVDTGTSLIRRISADGTTVETIAGSGVLGGRDGEGPKASFRQPSGIVVAPDGALYVADQGNQTIRRITNQGGAWMVETVAGKNGAGGEVDGPAPQARFSRPAAIDADQDGNLYVVDMGGNTVRRIDGHTFEVTTVAGSGVAGNQDAGVGTQARFNMPVSVAVAPGGQTLYVFDAQGQTLRRVSLAGSHPVTTIAGDAAFSSGAADGSGNDARFRSQMGLAALPNGDLVLADTANFRLRLVTPGTDRGSTQVFTLAGSGALGTALGAADKSDLPAPTGVAVLPTGDLVVSDSFSNVVRRVSR